MDEEDTTERIKISGKDNGRKICAKKKEEGKRKK